MNNSPYTTFDNSSCPALSTGKRGGSGPGRAGREQEFRAESRVASPKRPGLRYRDLAGAWHRTDQAFFQTTRAPPVTETT